MSVDIYLKFEGVDIKGESKVKGHEEEIQVFGWNFGCANRSSGHLGTGSGSGHVDVSDIGLTKYIDSSSTRIMSAVCQGTHIPKAIITTRKAGDKPLDYLVLTLENVFICHYSTSVGNDEVIFENFTISFTKFNFSYQPQGFRGAKDGGSKEYTYDIAAREKG